MLFVLEPIGYSSGAASNQFLAPEVVEERNEQTSPLTRDPIGNEGQHLQTVFSGVQAHLFR
jgi:hypothetical protein